MPYSFADLRGSYAALFATVKVTEGRQLVFVSIARRMNAGMERYQEVEKITGVPASIIAVIHQRESSGDFRTHLHNGDPLNARTYHVPAGRPKNGSPPFAWEDSAIDALRYQGLDKISDWSIERACFVLEAYNGFGYRNKGLRSPYLWGGTNHQQSGKYVEDGKFDSTKMDPQPGCVGMLVTLWAMYPELRLGPSPDVPVLTQPTPEKPPVLPPSPVPPFPWPSDVAVPKPRLRPSPQPPPPPPAPSPVAQGVIATAVAALVGGLVMFGHQVADWFAHLFN